MDEDEWTVIEHLDSDKYSNPILAMAEKIWEFVEDDNNGWIRVESESDLPNKDKTMYHVSKNEKVFNSPVNHGTVLKWWYSNKITHYQPIVKPNTPIC